MNVMNKELCGLVRCFPSREQDISKEQQPRDLINETIKSGDESMTQLNDKYFE